MNLDFTRRRRTGFTLVELMMAVALVSILIALSMVNFKALLMRAKRTEATTGLRALWLAERAHQLHKGEYSGSFTELDFEIEGGKRVSSQTYRGGRYVYQLSQPWGADSFYCIATAQLDEDEWPDVLEIYELPEAQ